MNSTQAGFSLIELIIVIAIIAILAAIAIPLYLNYTARAQGTEALSLASAFKPAVTTYYALHGSFSGIKGNKTLGMPAPKSISGRYVRSVGIGNVSAYTLDVTATFCYLKYDAGCDINEALSGQTLYLSAFVANKGKTGSIQWVCWVNNESEYPYIPPECRHTRRRP